ncbi:hypothetical protein APHAL10511_002705 [Amanita phalloides]|nr:hypothetical protein APHAL10511_002705 [Amanita phalloides]
MAKVQFAEFAFVSPQKNNMSVALHPSASLGFHRPLTQLAKRSLTITNNNALPVAFKVKTTAPKLYCVRPNSGRVEPGQSVEVSVMLQAMKEEPPLNAKCKDKFLIQSTLITPEKESMSLQDIWAVPDGQEESSKVHQQKLKVVFLPEGQPLIEEPEQLPISHTNSIAQPQNGVQQPTEVVEVVQPSKQEPQRPITPHNAYSNAREESQDHEEPTGEVHTEVLPPLSHMPPVPILAAVSEAPVDRAVEQRTLTPEPGRAIPTPAPPSQPSRQASRQPPVHVPGRQELRPEDIEAHPIFQALLARYDAALTQLDQLRIDYDALSEPPKSELRERRRGRSDMDSVAGDSDMVDVREYQQDGVPLQVVVIVALAVFITTYLFL